MAFAMFYMRTQFRANRHALFGCITMALFAASISSRATEQPPATTPPSAVSPVAVVLPLVDAANELNERALVDALRGGGYVLYMRHALQIAPLEGPCVGSNLTPVGEEQVRIVAAAIRTLKIPIGRVLSSEPCRNRDTATRLGLGEIEITEDLNPVPSQASIELGVAREKRLREIPARGTNTILVSHLHGSRKKSEWMHLELAEMIVYQPNGATTTAHIAPVARIRVETWPALLRAAGL